MPNKKIFKFVYTTNGNLKKNIYIRFNHLIFSFRNIKKHGIWHIKKNLLHQKYKAMDYDTAYPTINPEMIRRAHDSAVQRLQSIQIYSNIFSNIYKHLKSKGLLIT